MMTPLHKITQVLADMAPSGTFACRARVPTDTFSLQVDGVGPLELPVSRAQAQVLCDIARPACFGRGERTLMDARVRDTLEIPSQQLRLTHPEWPATLAYELDGIRHALGLPHHVALAARLDKLLVYGPGGHFKVHQDSERSDDMLGTLSVVLPSECHGGKLEVTHGEQRLRFAPPHARRAPALDFVAFYADCPHTVEPVIDGHRIVLSFQLSRSGGQRESRDHIDTGTALELHGLLAGHFESHERFVYLLDHEYTQRSLSWDRLKGEDAKRIATLTTASDALGCERHLALVIEHETWDCYESGDDPYDRRYDKYDYDDEDDQDETDTSMGGLALNSLIERYAEIAHVVDSKGRPLEWQPGMLDDDETCWTLPSRELDPEGEEYEGNMGNYGNTLDRWYQRGALLLWPEAYRVSVRAASSPGWAVDELLALLQRGEPDQARTELAAMLARWQGPAARQATTAFLGRVLQLAGQLDDARLSAALLAPFRLRELDRTNLLALARLGARHGAEWLHERIAAMHSTERDLQRSHDPSTPSDLARVCRDAAAAGDALLVAALRERVIVHAESLQARMDDQGSRGLTPANTSLLADTAEGLLHLVDASATLEQADVVDGLVSSLLPDDDAERLAVVLPALCATDERKQLAARCGAVIAAVFDAVLGAAHRALSRPARAQDDWSMKVALACRCELCSHLAEFLYARDQRRLDWPLATPDRAHVHQQLDAFELPVRHETRRQGRPYTLVLTKLPSLFTRDARRREALARDVVTLEQLREAQ